MIQVIHDSIFADYEDFMALASVDGLDAKLGRPGNMDMRINTLRTFSLGARVSHMSQTSDDLAQLGGSLDVRTHANEITWDEDLDSSWRNGNTVGLAKSILAEYKWSLHPVLADALEEAGCDNRLVLDTLRTRCYSVHNMAILFFLTDPDAYERFVRLRNEIMRTRPQHHNCRSSEAPIGMKAAVNPEGE